jgi:hypothetical protein
MDIPLCSQMAFAAAQDLRTLIVVTPRQDTKYDNMSSNPNVSFLVSTAKNDPSDPVRAQALTVTAFATELDGERRHQAVNLFSRSTSGLERLRGRFHAARSWNSKWTAIPGQQFPAGDAHRPGVVITSQNLVTLDMKMRRVFSKCMNRKRPLIPQTGIEEG